MPMSSREDFQNRHKKLKMENPSASTATVNPELQAKIQRKQKERHDQFTKLRNIYILNEHAKSIVQLPGAELRRKLQSREISAREVLEAFTAKALEVTEKFNCVTEFIPQALEWASTLDKEPTTSHRPLRGLPIAIKDDHDVEGLDSTLGFAKNLYKPARESAALVQILVELGAVPFAKTNAPQSLCSSGSDNPIFGTTLNALNPEFAPGGSSSGSGCIVAAGGAAFATGSDSAGSLRIPSHFHGVCTIRPTANRLSEKGLVQCLPELVLQPGVPGIISPDAETLALVWRAITENNIQNRFDPMAVPIPWNESLFSSGEKLRIGYFTSLSFFPSFEDTRKTVLAAKRAFESRGHTVVEFEMPDDFHCLKTNCDLMMADHGRYLEKMFRGEPVSDCVAGMIGSLRAGGSSNAPSDSGLSKRDKILFGDWSADIKTSVDLWDVAYEKSRIIQDLLGRMEKAGIDLILGPAFPFPAVKLHDGYGRLSGVPYTVIWNFMDFPAGVIRFGTETGAGINNYEDQNETMLKLAKEAVKESAGMPINVQIVGKPFKEEHVLRAMVELEKLQTI